VIFVTLFYLTARRGVTDPVCGMKIDRSKAVTAEHAGRTYYFCSDHCRSQFQADPDGYTRKGRAAPHEHAMEHAH
jgi:YHS domain-containing protein